MRSLVAIILSVVWIMPPAVAYANGQIGQSLKQVAGPYEITLGTVPDTPVVGNLHLAITITDALSKTPVLDAEVTVVGKGPNRDTTGIGPLLAQNSVRAPSFYDINTSVDRVGTWTFTVSVNANLGNASTDFAIIINDPNPIFRIFTWVTIALFFSVLSLGFLPLLRNRAKNGKGN